MKVLKLEPRMLKSKPIKIECGTMCFFLTFLPYTMFHHASINKDKPKPNASMYKDKPVCKIRVPFRTNPQDYKNSTKQKKEANGCIDK